MIGKIDMQEYCIYCDESCHLENDGIPIMAFGAIWFPKGKKSEIFSRLKELKSQNNLPLSFELKWNKVSEGLFKYYLDNLNYFFDDDDIRYRGLIVKGKAKLNHDAFGQDHNTFYYKMYFDLLKVILAPSNSNEIYIDIKDTQGASRVRKLEEVLRNNHYDYKREIIKRVQQVDSQEVIALQLTDLLTGALGYVNRGLDSSSAKMKLINKIKQRSGYSLVHSTLLKEEKFNLFVWEPK